jgi:hypothetical protein
MKFYYHVAEFKSPFKKKKFIYSFEYINLKFNFTPIIRFFITNLHFFCLSTNNDKNLNNFIPRFSDNIESKREKKYISFLA